MCGVNITDRIHTLARISPLPLDTKCPQDKNSPKRKLIMLRQKSISLRLIRDERDCRIMIEAYNEILERAQTDHTEIKSLKTILKDFDKDGFWSDDRGTMLIIGPDDEIIGSIHFNRCSEFELEIGYRIYRQKERGHGYMREALPLFSAYLFETKAIRRLRLQTASDNVGSRKVAESSGYKREGVLRQAYFYRGKMCDSIIYGLLREECILFTELMTDSDNSKFINR